MVGYVYGCEPDVSGAAAVRCRIHSCEKKNTCVEALVARLLVRFLCECLCVWVGDVREVAVGAEAFAIVEEVPAVHFAVESARHLGEAEQELFRFGVVLQLLSGFLGAAVRCLAAEGRLKLAQSLGR